MSLKSFFAGSSATLLALVLGLTATTHAAPPAGKEATAAKAAKHRLVIQVSDADPKRWNLALNNARNIIQEVGADNVEIEIVAFGPGIAMLKANSEVADRLGEATSDDVKLMACENTMKAQKLTRDDMSLAVNYVPAGVVEIMKKQEEGYAYLRP